MGRKGAAFLGGDAAHTMPPYLGQGACSGIRDAANIAWKLDLVLAGKASPDLLDAYEVERKPHVTDIMKTAMMLGKVANTHSRFVAFFRDLAFRFNLVPPPPPFPPFAEGVVQGQRSGKGGKVAGSVPPQGFVIVDGVRGRLDDFVGYRFALVAKTNPAKTLYAGLSVFTHGRSFRRERKLGRRFPQDRRSGQSERAWLRQSIHDGELGLRPRISVTGSGRRHTIAQFSLCGQSGARRFWRRNVGEIA